MQGGNPGQISPGGPAYPHLVTLSCYYRRKLTADFPAVTFDCSRWKIHLFLQTLF
jgi:hypothetical protein